MRLNVGPRLGVPHNGTNSAAVAAGAPPNRPAGSRVRFHRFLGEAWTYMVNERLPLFSAICSQSTIGSDLPMSARRAHCFADGHQIPGPTVWLIRPRCGSARDLGAEGPECPACVRREARRRRPVASSGLPHPFRYSRARSTKNAM
jgi:hypothetical protein